MKATTVTVASIYQLGHVSKESDLRRMAANRAETEAASLNDIVVAGLFNSLAADNDNLCRPLHRKDYSVQALVLIDISPMGR